MQSQITAKWGYPTTGDADLTGFKIEYMKLVVGGNAPVRLVHSTCRHRGLCISVLFAALTAARAAHTWPYDAYMFHFQRPTVKWPATMSI